MKEKTCFPAQWLSDNDDLKADNCIIKTEVETPEKCWRQRMLLSKSNSPPTVPFKFCLSGQNTLILRLELFQSKNRQISVLILPLLIKVFTLNVYGLMEQFPITHVRLNIINTVLDLKKTIGVSKMLCTGS